MLNRLRPWLRSLLFGRRLDREMRDEMADHLARTEERLVAHGMTREEAERAARREFGNPTVLREEGRDARGGRRLESLAADIRYGLRQFARRPVSTITMIVVLALGIGFNSALFVLVSSFVRGVPPGFTPHESLVRIRGIDRNPSRGFNLGREFSYPEYAEYAAQTTLFSAVAAWTSSDVALDVGRDEESLHSGAATYVTSSYFPVLGVGPIAGAGLPVQARDDVPELVTVISYTVWDRFYGQANDVVGRTLKVNGVPVTIVGVAPRRFNGARTGGSQIRVWLPLGARPLVQRTPAHPGQSPDTAILGIVARLQPGVQASQTLPIVEAIAARTDAQQATQRAGILATDVVPLLADNYFPPSGEVQDRRRQLVGQLIPLLVPLLVLSITCTTVSALQAGLAIARRREMAVRLALGAARSRLVRQLVTESVLLALGGAALGLFVIWVLLRVFESAVPDLHLAIDWLYPHVHERARACCRRPLRSLAGAARDTAGALGRAQRRRRDDGTVAIAPAGHAGRRANRAHAASAAGDGSLVSADGRKRARDAARGPGRQDHRRALQHQPAIRSDGRRARTGAGAPADAVRGAAGSGRRRAARECRRQSRSRGAPLRRSARHRAPVRRSTSAHMRRRTAIFH